MIHGTVLHQGTVSISKSATALMVTTEVTTATMEVMVTTVKKDIVSEKNECCQTFKKSDIFYIFGPEKQDLRKTKEAGESKAPVPSEKGAALMLQGERELFGE